MKWQCALLLGALQAGWSGQAYADSGSREDLSAQRRLTPVHPFGYWEADEPFRFDKPRFLHQDSLDSPESLDAQARREGILIEVCRAERRHDGLWHWPEDTQKARRRQCVVYARGER
jgi:hypothetical protein